MSKPKSLMASIPLPPFAIYYFSHEGKRGPNKNGRVRDMGKRLTYQQMAERAGMPQRSFLRLTSKLTWEGVPIDVADKFCRGCGVDILHFSKHRYYLAKSIKKGCAFSYLSKRQASRFRELCIRAKALAVTGS